MKNISVIGAGYVGLVTAACFAELGNEVKVIEIDVKRMDALESGRMPINEPGLAKLWKLNQAEGRICVTNNYYEGLLGADFVFISVGTPSTKDGRADLKYICSAAKSIAQSASGPLVVVIKSTVPIGTADLVSEILENNCHNGHKFSIVSNPEFLREGLAVFDFMNPSRIAVGGTEQTIIDSVAELYAPLDSSVIKCDIRTAEMSKYASNVFLATRISFMNEIAILCDECGADVVRVSEIMGLDPRFGKGYLSAGLGWGGSCLPKDVQALLHMGKSYQVPMPMVRAVQRINQRQPALVVKKLQCHIGSLRDKRIGILGLSFKPGSDDMREARSIQVVSLLEKNECMVSAYDPVAMGEAAKIMPRVTYCEDAYEVASGSDALVLVTEWDEFKVLDFKKLASLMERPILVDSRNMYDPEEMVKAGFIYESFGRGSIGRKKPEEVMIT